MEAEQPGEPESKAALVQICLKIPSLPVAGFYYCWDRYATDYRLSGMREPWGTQQLTHVPNQNDVPNFEKVPLKNSMNSCSI